MTSSGDVVVRLVRPSRAGTAALLEVIAEYRGGAMDGSGVPPGAQRPTTEAEAQELIDRLRAGEDPATPLDPGWVHCSSRWVVAAQGSEREPEATRDAEGERILGFLALRHALTPYLHDVGGHIGYSVRPTERRRGLATAALRCGLDEAAALGIDPVLITCAADNIASRRVIESAGGRWESRLEGVERFWIGDDPRPPRPRA